MKTIFAAILFLAICAGIVHADLSLPILRSGWTTTTDPGQALNALGLGSNAVVVVDSGVAVPGDSYTELYVQQNGISQNLLRDDLTTDGMNNYGDIQIYTPGGSSPFLSAAVANSDAYAGIQMTDPDTGKFVFYVDTPNQSTTVSEPTIGGDIISGWNNGSGQSSVGVFDGSQQNFGEEDAIIGITNTGSGPGVWITAPVTFNYNISGGYWSLNQDGSAVFANGEATIGADGSISAASGNYQVDNSGNEVNNSLSVDGEFSINYDGSASNGDGSFSLGTDGSAVFAGDNIQFNADGSGYASQGSFSWDVGGEITIDASGAGESPISVYSPNDTRLFLHFSDPFGGNSTITATTTP